MGVSRRRREEERGGARSEEEVGRSVGRSVVGRSAAGAAPMWGKLEPEVPASRNEPRGSQVLRLAASRGGAPKRARVPSRA